MLNKHIEKGNTTNRSKLYKGKGQYALSEKAINDEGD